MRITTFRLKCFRASQLNALFLLLVAQGEAVPHQDGGALGGKPGAPWLHPNLQYEQ